MPTPDPTPNLDVVETCMRVSRLIDQCPLPGDTYWVAEQLGWTETQLNEFTETYGSLLVNADKIINLPPTESEILNPSLPANAPSEEEITRAIQRADDNLLRRGLQSIGLTESEAQEAQALQQFNRENFRASMDMVSANTLRTSLKLAIQQRIIEQRVKFVRETIESYEEFSSEERTEWVREERMLMRQYVEIGELLNQIQDTWYKGSAALAVIKMKMRENNNANGRFMTQRSNQPGFRSNFVEAKEPPE